MVSAEPNNALFRACHLAGVSMWLWRMLGWRGEAVGKGAERQEEEATCKDEGSLEPLSSQCFDQYVDLSQFCLYKNPSEAK